MPALRFVTGSVLLLLSGCGSGEGSKSLAERLAAEPGLTQAVQLAGSLASAVSPPVALALRLQEAQRQRLTPIALPEPASPALADASLVGAYVSQDAGRAELLVLDAAGGFALHGGDEAGPLLAQGTYLAAAGGVHLLVAGASARVLLGHPDGELLDAASPLRQRFVPLTPPARRAGDNRGAEAALATDNRGAEAALATEGGAR